ncbi:hypothetical protein HDU93_001737 [Gonapodya sp. JEL0774]|nr:hypothetical protein HDU93_001737 [Gonapodya sp. JEL0774]
MSTVRSSSPIPSFRLLDLPAPILLRISIRWTDHRLGLPTPALSRFLARLFGSTVTLTLRASRRSGSPGAALREECQRDVVDCDVVKQLLRFRSIRRHLPAALLHTVERGLLDAVALLGGRAGAKVLEDAMGMAARRGYHDIFILLWQFHDGRVIQEGPRTSTKDDDSRFPYNLLENAVETLPILNILLGRCLVNDNPGFSQKDFNFAFERTCATSNLAAMSALLQLRTQLMDRGVRVRHIKFQEHLEHSIFGNNIDLAQYLLDNGASPNDSIDGYRYPLETAIQHGNLAIFNLFMRYGATIPPHRPSPLHLAASAGHVQIVEALLDAGANVDSISLTNSDDFVGGRFTTDTPLTVAITQGELDVARLLLARGADVLLPVISSGPEWPTSPIVIAARRHELAFVQLLCDHLQKSEKTFDINLKSAREQAIHDALAAGACVGSKSIVEFLLSRGANPNLGRYFGESALTGASKQWGVSIVQILLKHGAEVSIDNNGPLRAAFSSQVGYGDTIVQLLDSGAQVRAVELETIAGKFRPYQMPFDRARYVQMLEDIIQRLDVDFCRQLLPHIHQYDKTALGQLQRRIDSDNSAICVYDNLSMSRGGNE